MAMLDESNLLAMRARAAKFRTNHVGTKLNEAELHEFEALAEKRKQTPSELIRGLVLDEIERDKHPPRASVELEEIASLRLLLLNILPVLARGERMTDEGSCVRPLLRVSNQCLTVAHTRPYWRAEPSMGLTPGRSEGLPAVYSPT